MLSSKTVGGQQRLVQSTDKFDAVGTPRGTTQRLKVIHKPSIIRFSFVREVGIGYSRRPLQRDGATEHNNTGYRT